MAWLRCDYCGEGKEVTEKVARRFAGASKLRCQKCRETVVATEDRQILCVYSGCMKPLLPDEVSRGSCDRCYRFELAREISLRLGYFPDGSRMIDGRRVRWTPMGTTEVDNGPN